jgi:hypothetical protein
MTDKVTVITGYYDYENYDSQEGDLVEIRHCVIGLMAARKGIAIPEIGEDAIEDAITSESLLTYRLAIQDAYNVSLEQLEVLQDANDSNDVARLNQRLKEYGITDFEVSGILPR